MFNTNIFQFTVCVTVNLNNHRVDKSTLALARQIIVEVLYVSAGLENGLEIMVEWTME